MYKNGSAQLQNWCVWDVFQTIVLDRFWTRSRTNSKILSCLQILATQASSWRNFDGKLIGMNWVCFHQEACKITSWWSWSWNTNGYHRHSLRIVRRVSKNWSRLPIIKRIELYRWGGEVFGMLFSFQAIPRIVHMWYICPRRLLTGSLRKVHQRFGVCMWSLTTHWQLRNFNENPTINFNGRVYAPQYTQIVDAGLALFLSLPSITLQFWINSIIILENHKSIWYSMSVFFPGWFRMVWNIIDVRYAKKKSKKHPPPY